MKNTKKFLAITFIFALLLPSLSIARDANAVSRLTDSQKALHVLNRLAFGASERDLGLINKIGLEKYIELQLNPDQIDDQRVEAELSRFEVLAMNTGEIFAKYPNPGGLQRAIEGKNAVKGDAQVDPAERRKKLQAYYEKYNLKPASLIMQQVQSARIIRAAYSERQLQEVMVDFWANHFSVYSNKAATRWFIPSYERDVIRKHALGNFRDLLVGSAQHPAMLFYLDNFQSVAAKDVNENQTRLLRSLNNGQLPPQIRERMRARGLSDQEIDKRIEQAKSTGNSKNKRGINENYARELLELHTLGVDGGYSQNDIKEVARAFTGWTIFDPRGYRRAAGLEISGEEDKQLKRLARQFGIPEDTESGKFVFAANLHDKGEKTVLGKKLKSGGMQDGLDVLDMLVSNPATARFLARKLAVKFVSDEPSEAYVGRIADAFLNSKGDIKTTLRAIFTDKEFFAPENYRAKIKTPFELVASSIRAIDARTNGGGQILGLLSKMGEPLYGYQAPTGFPETAADWVNTGALLERMNFAVALASNRIPQTRVDLSKFAGSSNAITLNNSIAAILHNEISPATKAMLEKQMGKPIIEATLDTPEDEDSSAQGENMPNRARRANRLREPSGDPNVFKIVSLILGSPEFQRQ